MMAKVAQRYCPNRDMKTGLTELDGPQTLGPAHRSNLICGQPLDVHPIFRLQDSGIWWPRGRCVQDGRSEIPRPVVESLCSFRSEHQRVELKKDACSSPDPSARDQYPKQEENLHKS